MAVKSLLVLPLVLSCVLLCLIQAPSSVSAVYWPCNSDSECNSVVPRTYCNAQGYCECPAGHVFSADVSECLTNSLHSEACQEGVQCSHMLTGAVCSSNQCTCREGLTYLQGRCRTLAPLFADCETDVDCAFGFDRESVICKENKCQCANGFYQRSENICRRILYNVGDVCSIHADCQGIGEGHYCNNFKCALRAGRTVSDETKEDSLLQRTLGVQTSIDEVPRRSTIGVNTSASLDIPETSADDEEAKFGDDCPTNGQQCPGLPHSECVRNKCLCQPGYYPRNGVCFAELGEVADSSSLCATVYRDGKCVCTYDQFYLPNMRGCIKTVAKVTDFCTQQSQCTPFGEAYCSNDAQRRCTCRDYAIHDDEQQLCVKRVGLRQFCEKNEDCEGVSNTECNVERNTCLCKTNYFEENEKCRPGVGASCSVDSDCGIVNSECGEESSGASRTQVPVEEDPLRRFVHETIHEEMEIDEDAEGDDEETELLGGLELAGRRKKLRKQSTVVVVPSKKKSVSSSSSSSSSVVSVISPISVQRDEGKTCKCKENFVAKNNECVEKTQQYGGDCEHTEQCTPLLGELSECNADGQCVCKDEAHFNYNKCNKKVMLGETCARVSDCFVEENKDLVQCRNAQCQCGFTSTMDSEQRKCVTISSKNSSSRPSPLKVITLILIAAAVFVTTAAIRDAVQRSQGR